MLHHKSPEWDQTTEEPFVALVDKSVEELGRFCSSEENLLVEPVDNSVEGIVDNCSLVALHSME